MPPARILPPAKELAERLKNDPNLSFSELSRQYGVSRQALTQALRRAHLEVSRGPAYTVKEFVPWRVKVEHEQHLYIRMLRLWAREQKGLPLPKDRVKIYRELLAWLDDNDLVIAYDRETGFSAVPREDGDGRYWRP